MKKTLSLSELPKNVTFRKEAVRDFLSLAPSNQPEVLKAIQKVALNPKPANEGGYGKPLGNWSGNNLSGFLKIKLKKSGIRIVYEYIKTNNGMDVIVIGLREDFEVYEEASRRIKKG